MTLSRNLLLTFALVGGGVAFANEPPPGGHGEGAQVEHEGGAAHGGEHHACYSCDDDHDGTANWLDADSGEETYVVPRIGFHLVNLLIFAGILLKFGRPAVADMFRSRALVVRRDLHDAAKVKAEAEARHAALQARLDALSSEIAAMEETARREAAVEEQKIEQRAREAAARVLETSQRQIRDEATRARLELRREAVSLAVELAEGILKGQVQPVDQRRLAQEFLEQVQKDGVNGNV